MLEIYEIDFNECVLFSLPRNLKQEHIQIRFNLVVAIAVAQILFLAGIDATSKQVTANISGQSHQL